jgi:hypothetical protein
MSKVKADSYKELLAKLEADYQKEVESREMATGNQAEVYSEVGRRAVADREFQTKRSRYLEAINEEEEVSSGVASFLKKDEPVSKFDLDSNKSKLDDSMNPLGGKQI